MAWPPTAARNRLSEAGTQQAELLSGQTSDQVSIHRATQEALGNDQSKPRSGHFFWRYAGGNVAGNAGFSAPS
jgi:hypothetical protein